jgi:hypothetical protein
VIPARQDKWYFRTYVYIIAFLCIGPLALPLVWFNPRLGWKKKVLISVLAVAVFYLLTTVLARSVKNILDYYQLMLKELK